MDQTLRVNEHASLGWQGMQTHSEEHTQKPGSRLAGGEILRLASRSSWVLTAVRMAGSITFSCLKSLAKYIEPLFQPFQGNCVYVLTRKSNLLIVES